MYHSVVFSIKIHDYSSEWSSSDIGRTFSIVSYSRNKEKREGWNKGAQRPKAEGKQWGASGGRLTSKT